ncbi:MAG: hypothetical protein HYX59_03825 [Elusimicrobia bacterium]|nr:hypothetical protein [Elusimicrobiota bacterium]
MLRRAVLAVLALAAFAAAADPAVLTLGERAERHVRESHFAGGRRSRGKSLFLPGTDLLRLLKAAEKAKPVRQENGRDKRVAAAKDAIGTDGRSGRPVKTCVVISEPDGAVVTMYPGR